MERRPLDITEEDYDEGVDMQGLRWGIGDIPIKEDFREKRYHNHIFPLISSVKDYGSLIVKPPPPPVSINPVRSLSKIILILSGARSVPNP